MAAEGFEAETLPEVSEVAVMARKKSKVVIDTTETRIRDDELPGMLYGDFLRADEVAEGDVVVIKSPAVLMTTRFGTHRVVQVIHDGKMRVLRLNRISLRNLVDAWGNDSKAWVDQEARIVLVTILGKNTIVLEPFQAR